MKKIIAIEAGICLVGMIFFAQINGTSSSAMASNDDVRLKTFVHYPKDHGRPAPPSYCSVTINDQVSDFGLAGWQMPTAGMSYAINYGTKPTNLTNNDVLNGVNASFAAWSAADSKQIFSNAGATNVRNAKRDGVNAILWKPISGSAIAITYAWYNTLTGQLVEADTVFNRNLKWSQTAYTAGDCDGVTGTYDLQNIGTHEFGHWVGLNDLYNTVDKDLTMYGYGETKELKKDTLGAGDVIGVNTIAP